MSGHFISEYTIWISSFQIRHVSKAQRTCNFLRLHLSWSLHMSFATIPENLSIFYVKLSDIFLIKSSFLQRLMNSVLRRKLHGCVYILYSTDSIYIENMNLYNIFQNLVDILVTDY